jgi:hypothetical protein
MLLTDKKNGTVQELSDEALELVTGGAGKHATFSIFSNEGRYSGATIHSGFLKASGGRKRRHR